MKVNILAFAALCIFCFSACKQDNGISDSTTQDIQKMKDHLCSTYGFLPESIVETPTDLIAEGDQVFSKATYWEDHSDTGEKEFSIGAAPSADGSVSDRKHYRYTYLVDKYKWQTIHVNINYDVPQSWRDAIIDAVAEWNAADGWLDFDITYINYSVNGSINVKMSSDIVADLTVASCYYPTSNQKPGSPMYINPKHNDLNYSKKVFAMVHEIGHALGIRHTDQGQGTLITKVSANCRNNADWASVMQPYVDYWYGFTDCDLEAYYALYGR